MAHCYWEFTFERECLMFQARHSFIKDFVGGAANMANDLVWADEPKQQLICQKELIDVAEQF